MREMQTAKARQTVHRRSARWYPKRNDDMIIQRWAEACSEKHKDCLDCPYLRECQDLVDRLISCMDVQKPGHRETVDRDY